MDEDEYTSDEAEGQDQVSNMSFPTAGNVSNVEGEKKTRNRSTSNVSVEDVLNAREFRKRVFSNTDAPGQFLRPRSDLLLGSGMLTPL